jgi:RHS repeat-associated protein
LAPRLRASVREENSAAFGVPAAPDYAPTLAASGRRRPPQRATLKNSRRGFFGSPSGRTLSRRHLPRRAAPGYRACGYKTASGRPKWLSRDPAGEEGGLNLYGYVGNDPLNRRDPTGLIAGVDDAVEADAVLVGGAILAGVGAYEAVRVLQQSNIDLANTLAAIRVHNEAAKPAGKCPTAEDVKGKTPEEIGGDLKDKGWVDSPTREGDGTRYTNPDRPGEQVRVMPGNPDDPNPVKQGPYIRISTNGTVSPPIPAAGNPTLNP